MKEPALSAEQVRDAFAAAYPGTGMRRDELGRMFDEWLNRIKAEEFDRGLVEGFTTYDCAVNGEWVKDEKEIIEYMRIQGKWREEGPRPGRQESTDLPADNDTKEDDK